MCGLLIKCEVKMAGSWPSSFFACLWTKTESRSIKINAQKTDEVNIHQYSANKLAWSIRLYHTKKRTLNACRTRQVILSRQNRAILTAQVTNHSAVFVHLASSSHLARHIIKYLAIIE